jgi:hypothetical protein
MTESSMSNANTTKQSDQVKTDPVKTTCSRKLATINSFFRYPIAIEESNVVKRLWGA